MPRPEQSEQTRSQFTRESVVGDYRVAFRSRQASLIGRKEVLTGKAKFGIFGDGKEVAQLAMARAFRPGDFRSGYYRDQTFMMALGLLTVEQFFAQLYAEPGRPADERPLLDEPDRPGRFLARFGRHPELVRRPLADGIADAAPRWPRLGFAAVPRAARPRRDVALFAQRRRGGLRHDRQR